MVLRYCRRCILPNTRPNLRFDERGVCNCATKEKKDNIDWADRERKFDFLVEEVKSIGATYDCVIPVSGGKDSTWQVAKSLDYGLKPLCVTWKTPARGQVGRKNLENLIGLGVNHVEFSVDPVVERKFILKSFERFGTPAIPMHMALHSIPVKVAIGFKVPLVIWGENSAFEYGGDDEKLKGVSLTNEWFMRYGVTNATKAGDWVDETLTSHDLEPYCQPSNCELKQSGLKAVFLGYYFRWDPIEIYEYATRHGFSADSRPKTGLYAFADIDDEFLITIHHWMKWYKFGFTRLWDNLSLEIRSGRISRGEAIDIVREVGEERPEEEIQKFCRYVGISRSLFFQIAEKFRNRDIWEKTDNRWKINGFLIPSWKW